MCIVQLQSLMSEHIQDTLSASCGQKSTRWVSLTYLNTDGHEDMMNRTCIPLLLNHKVLAAMDCDNRQRRQPRADQPRDRPAAQHTGGKRSQARDINPTPRRYFLCYTMRLAEQQHARTEDRG